MLWSHSSVDTDTVYRSISEGPAPEPECQPLVTGPMTTISPIKPTHRVQCPARDNKQNVIICLTDNSTRFVIHAIVKKELMFVISMTFLFCSHDEMFFLFFARSETIILQRTQFAQNKNILLYVNTSHIEHFMLWKLEIKAHKMLNKCKINIFTQRHNPWHLDISFLLSANTVTVHTYMQKYANSTGSKNGGGMFLKKYLL